MEIFSEDHSKQLLSKEWLVKVDSEKSTPYLLKFYASTNDLSCCILVTDTKTVWSEVLSNKHTVIRWKECNPGLGDDRSDTTKSCILDLLSAVHCIGGIADVPFEIIPSKDADLAFELDCEGFKWRWDTYLLGPKTSAEILSRHLILPLISLTHLSFYSADPVSELSEADLEKAVDKIGRSARRTVDTHVKHAISKPRVSTTLQRMSAMFNFNPSLPPIRSEMEKPDLEKRIADLRAQQSSYSIDGIRFAVTNSGNVNTHSGLSRTSVTQDRRSDNTDNLLHPDDPLTQVVPGRISDSGSATEQDSDDIAAPIPPPHTKGQAKQRSPSPFSQFLARPSVQSESSAPGSTPQLSSATHTGVKPGVSNPGSSSDSSPVRPVRKKSKTQLPGDSDSDADSEEQKQGPSRVGRGAGVTRGVRQPIKRGAKRF